jgi:GntR family transcriptional regulator
VTERAWSASDAAIIELDPTSELPKYLQIAEQVRSLVARGLLAAGAELPSVRQLAGDLGINVNTVLAAYRQLDSDGVVLLRQGSRAVVHPRMARPEPPRTADLVRLRALLERTRIDARLAGLTANALRALIAEVFRDEFAAGGTPEEGA